jgi:molybdenum cofactor cytidylyltransferase
MADAGPCVVLLLAAGGSTRMGRAKQLLQVEGQPLVRRAARTAIDAGLHRVLVVLGAEAARIRPVIADLDVDIVLNPDWTEGIASSLRAGVAAVERDHPDARGLIVMMADQPGISAAHLGRINAARCVGGAPIVGSDYGDFRGPPAYFARGHFATLKSLRGDVGARELLQAKAILTVAAPPGSGADLDSPLDYHRLLHG